MWASVVAYMGSEFQCGLNTLQHVGFFRAGIKSVFPALAVRFLTTRTPRKSLSFVFFFFFFFKSSMVKTEKVF